MRHSHCESRFVEIHFLQNLSRDEAILEIERNFMRISSSLFEAIGPNLE